MGLRSYKAMLQQQMNQYDSAEFDLFLIKMEDGFNDEDLKIVYELHAKYFEHHYNEPCGCGGAKKIDTINKWIDDLKKVHANGVQTKEL